MIKKYEDRVQKIATHVNQQLSTNFEPEIAVVTGSGLGFLSESLDKVYGKFNYEELPNFVVTSVPGHKGELICGNVNGIDVLVFAGRKHFYEFGSDCTDVAALREITLPVCIACKLGVKTFFATNAVGSLNPLYKVGDVALIKTHIGLFFPNSLRGDLPLGGTRFLPTNDIYSDSLRKACVLVAKEKKFARHIHESVYVAVTGPSYESVGDVIALRHLGADTVGMSVVPEVLMARSMGMNCAAASLVTNVVTESGENATSHTEVTNACDSEEVKERFSELFKAVAGAN